MRMPTPTTFAGPQLRACRQNANISPDDLAAQTDASLRGDVIEAYEAGDRQPSFARLRALAQALQVDPTELLERSRASSHHHWYREAAGLSHVEVAKHLGVHRSTISRWDITGEVPQQHQTACAQLYRIHPSALTNGHRIQLQLAEDIAAALDQQRGSRTRESYLNELITNALRA